MKKVSLVIASVAGVAGLTMLGMSFFDISSDVMLGFPGNMAFITQSTRGGVKEASTYRPGGEKEDKGGYPESSICGNGVVEQGEQCEVMGLGSGGWMGSGGWEGSGLWIGSGSATMCPMGMQCMNCACVSNPSSSGYSDNGSGPIVSCKTQYTVYSRAPAKVLIHIQPYQNGFPVKLPAGYAFGTPAQVNKIGSNVNFQVPIGSNGDGVRQNVSAGKYTANSFILPGSGAKIDCTPTTFEVKQNPAQYCGDGMLQNWNGEQCDTAITGAQCDGQGVCDSDCKCTGSSGSGGSSGYIDLELKTVIKYSTNPSVSLPIAIHTITNKGTQSANNFSVSSATYEQGGYVYRNQSIAQLDPGKSIDIQQQDVNSLTGKSELCNYNGVASLGNPKDIDSNPGTLGICDGSYTANWSMSEDDEDLIWN